MHGQQNIKTPKNGSSDNSLNANCTNTLSAGYLSTYSAPNNIYNFQGTFKK